MSLEFRCPKSLHYAAPSDEGGERWAVIGSLIETAKLNGVEPYAWLKDVLSRMLAGHPASRLDELLPWAWTPQTTVNN